MIDLAVGAPSYTPPTSATASGGFAFLFLSANGTVRNSSVFDVEAGTPAGILQSTPQLGGSTLAFMGYRPYEFAPAVFNMLYAMSSSPASFIVATFNGPARESAMRQRQPATDSANASTAAESTPLSDPPCLAYERARPRQAEEFNLCMLTQWNVPSAICVCLSKYARFLASHQAYCPTARSKAIEVQRTFFNSSCESALPRRARAPRSPSLSLPLSLSLTAPQPTRTALPCTPVRRL